jgi:hypothetical protein
MRVMPSSEAGPTIVAGKGEQMTVQQGWATKEFDNELSERGPAKMNWEESNVEVSRGCLFGNFMGVTLMVYPEGLISIPAVCSYTAPSPALAAASAKERFDKQNARDRRLPATAQNRNGGHLGPIVDHDLKCENGHCPCRKPGTTSQDRRKRARGDCNTLRWWETHTSWRLGPV